MAKDLIIRSSTEEFITFKLQEKDKGIQVSMKMRLMDDTKSYGRIIRC